MVIFTKKFGALDPHLPIVWDKVPKNVFFYTFPNTINTCLIPENAHNRYKLNIKDVVLCVEQLYEPFRTVKI